jgi:D-alanyl-D-alanine endopeptidase (penicillin-binding protein 7)
MELQTFWSRLAAIGLCAGLALNAAGRVPPRLVLRSAAAVIQDQKTGEILLDKRGQDIVPMASLTKLVTAMVVLDAGVDLHEKITILEEDKDVLRHSRSRLPVGTELSREEALLLALMSSENRAAHALGRSFPKGLAAFITAMNAKTKELGLHGSRFEDPTGLSSGNVASARDIARIVDASYRYARIRSCTTTLSAVILGRRGPIEFHNTNHLVQSPRWQIGLSKTGFIEESGQCLVMQAKVAQRPLLIVLMDASGNRSRFVDADRVRQWLEGPDPAPVRQARHRRARKVRR